MEGTDGINKILIANPYECIQINKNLVGERKNLRRAVTVAPLTAGQLLKEMRDGPEFTSVWLDFTGCYETKEDDNPKRNVAALLTKRKLPPLVFSW